MQRDARLSAPSPSFNCHSTQRFAEIAARVIEELRLEEDTDELIVFEELESSEKFLDEKENEQKEEDFEFTIVCTDPDAHTTSADEIFFNGQIRPIFPVFDRSPIEGVIKDSKEKPECSSPRRIPFGELLKEDRDIQSCSSSEADELEQIPAGTYCVWKPGNSPASSARCKKSNSTGYSRTWRFRDLLPRSHSDGKESFVFLTPAKSSASKPGKLQKQNSSSSSSSSSKSRVSKEFQHQDKSMAFLHEKYYGRNGSRKEVVHKRSFLPYSQDHVGFFANVNVISRNINPF